MMDLLNAAVFTLLLWAVVSIAWRLASAWLPKADTSVFVLGFGLLLQAVPALVVVWSGLANCFRWAPVLAITLALYGTVRHVCPCRRSFGQLFAHLAFARGYSTVTAGVVWLAFGLFLIVALNQLRYTVIDADSLWYHLVMPAEWVRTGSAWPADSVPTMAMGYPGFRQASVAWLSLPFGNEHLALMGVLEYPLLALATYTLARQFDASRALAAGAGLAAASTPVVVASLSTQGNDLALGIYAAAATTFCVRFLRDGRRGDAVFTGIGLGALAAAKFSGPAYCIVVLAVCAAQCGVRRLLSRRNLLALAVGPLLLAAPWYVRNLIAFGNPLWPAHIDAFGIVFEGPVGREFFAARTIGFDFELLLTHLEFFVDAHGWLMPVVAFASVLVVAAVAIRRRTLRASVVAIALPVLLLTMWLQHPFNLPRFDANYSHRYLIAWSAVTFASAAAALTSLLPRLPLGGLFAASALAGFAGESRLTWAVLIVAVGLALALRRPLVQDAAHGAWRVLCELRVPTWAMLGLTCLGTVGLQSVRGEWQHSGTVGYRDSSSEKGWGAIVRYVHRHVSHARVGMQGGHFFFPLIGEPWSNEVLLADQPLLDGPRKTPPEVLRWVDAQRLDYVVCCRERERDGRGAWVHEPSIATQLMRMAPDKFEIVCEHNGAHVLRVELR